MSQLPSPPPRGPERSLPALADPFAPGPGEAFSLEGRIEEAPSRGFNVNDYLLILKRRWKLVAALALVSTLGGLARYWVTPRQYLASAQIQIERRSLSNLASGGSNANPWLESFLNMEYYPTQYKLLQSRGLAERVVKNLRLTDSTHECSVGSFGGVGSGSPSAAADEAALGAAAQGLLGGLEVQPIPSTQLAVISYRSHSAHCAAAIANGFAEAFIDWGIEGRAERVGLASTFIEQQTETLENEIAAQERELQTLERRAGLVPVNDNSDGSTGRITSIGTDHQRARAERIQKESRLSEVKRKSDEALIDTASNPLISQLRSELLRLKQQYETELKTFRPEVPKMRELKSTVDDQQQALDAEIRKEADRIRGAAETEYRTALSAENAFARELALAQDQRFEQTSAATEVANLKRSISTKRDSLDDLTRRQMETSATGTLQQSRESNVKVVDRALVPGGPFRPSLRREVSLGGMFGLVLGLGLVFLLEFLDRSIKDPADLEKLVNLPTLAVIPESGGVGRGSYGYGYGAESQARKKGRWLEKKNADEEVAIELLPHARPRLAIAEAYRSLRTALLLSSAERLQVVAVTSAESGEGKTTTATNLAVVLAQLGRRVLLIDADLRKPRLHEVFKVSNRFGVVNLLTSVGGRLEEVFLRTPVPNLYLIPSGPIPPNPAELLASERMRELVRQVREAFDFVVIDTPPSLAVTDATLVGHLVDGMLLCFGAGKVPREEIRACRDRLARGEVKMLGTVLNRYRVEQGRYGKRYQRYEAYGAETAEEPAKDSAA